MFVTENWPAKWYWHVAIIYAKLSLKSASFHENKVPPTSLKQKKGQKKKCMDEVEKKCATLPNN